MKNYNYYEVVFRNYDKFEDTYSIYIKGTREPTIKEAEEFFKEDVMVVSMKLLK